MSITELLTGVQYNNDNGTRSSSNNNNNVDFTSIETCVQQAQED